MAGFEISGTTKLLGLIADPVEQARSPTMANALLRKRKRSGAFVLVPMQVPVDGLNDFTKAIRKVQNFAGAIVSMPHKVAIAPLLDDLTPDARTVGAVNVISRTAEGQLVGTLLDGEGFVAGLRIGGYEVVGASCLLVGAGGAGSAIAFALARHGCSSLTITNRTKTKAESLVSRVRKAFPRIHVDTGDGAGGTYDIAINATSLGMGNDDELPMSHDVLRRSGLIAECVVAPEMTRLLETARAQGCDVHTGIPMLSAQMDLMLNFMGVDGG